MFTVTVQTEFTAGHQLLIGRSRESLHSHKWLVIAAVEAQTLDEHGLVIDFKRLKEIMDTQAAKLVCGRMEDLPEFKDKNASAENIAKYLFVSIKSELSEQYALKYVEITETPGCRAAYSE